MGGFILDEQACALVAEVQAVFCAGAWVAVVILASSVIEAQLRYDAGGEERRFANLTARDELAPRLNHLRRLRNSYVHAKADQPALTVDAQWTRRVELEEQARQASLLMIEVLFRDPWI